MARTKETLATRVRARRTELGLSLADVAKRIEALGAERVKLSASYLSRIETGARYPSPRVIAALAVVLETTTDQLESGSARFTAVTPEGDVITIAAPSADEALKKARARGLRPCVIFEGQSPTIAWMRADEAAA